MGRKKDLLIRKDGRYKAVYNGKQFYGSTPTEARNKRDQYKAMVQGQGIINIRKDPVTVEEYAREWLPNNRGSIKANSYNKNAVHLDHLISRIGKKPLRMVTPVDIKGVYENCYAGCSKDYVNHAKSLYRSIFDSAIAEHLCLENPARSVVATIPSKAENGHHRAITPWERDVIHSMEDHPLQPVVMLLLYSGARPHEIYAFDPDRDVDFVAKTITLEVFGHIGVNGNEMYFDENGKNKRAHRTIALFPQLEQYLIGKHGYLIVPKNKGQLTVTAWRSAWRTYINACEKKINGCQKRWYGKRKCDKENLKKYDELVAQGKYQEAEQYRLPPWREFKVTPYDLRTSFCTFCRDSQVDINIVREWMGHTDLSMIARIYDQPTPERKKTALQKIVNDYNNQKRFNKVQKPTG